MQVPGMKMLCSICLKEMPFIALEANSSAQEDGSVVGYSKFKLECGHIIEMSAHTHIDYESPEEIARR